MIFRAAVCVTVYLFVRWIADCDAQGIGMNIVQCWTQRAWNLYFGHFGIFVSSTVAKTLIVC